MKKILGIGLIIAISFLVGCGTGNDISASNSIAKYKNGSDEHDIEVIVDKETGVEYLYVFQKEYGGNGVGVGSAITPRYNADGSLRVSN